MQNTIPHNKPCVDEKEVEAVRRVIDRSWLLSGEEVKKFEDKFKKLTNTKYAVAVNNGSSALHLSLVALGIKKGDEVIIPTYTDSALLNVINYVQATPVIIDIENDGFNIDIDQVKKSINNKTKAIIAPHTFGIPIDMNRLKNLGVPIIEDCAQALGSYYNGYHVGGNGEMGIFSFYATKVLATGQGGMIVTNNKEYYDLVRDLIDYDQRAVYKIRYNYQFNDISAALGNTQFDKMPKFIEKRKMIGSKYRSVLSKKGIKHWPDKNSSTINHFRFVIQLATKQLRESIQNTMKKLGITSIVPLGNYQMLHNQMNLPKKYFPNAEEMSETTLSIPIFPCLDEDQIMRIIEALSTMSMQ